VPRDLSEKFNGSNFRDSLLKRNEIEPFFKWLITVDEKWITYDNVRKRSWSKQGGKAKIDAKKSDAVCGEIRKESFTTSCCRPVERLILISIVNN